MSSSSAETKAQIDSSSDLTRPDRDKWFMSFAHVTSKRSTCARVQTGAVIVQDSRIVSIGYNGVAPKQTHCRDHWFKMFEDGQQNGTHNFKTWEEFTQSPAFAEAHHDWAVVHEFHGEDNAILWTAKKKGECEGATMYSVYSPCVHCAKAIVGAGITRVVYEKKYERDVLWVGADRNKVCVTLCVRQQM
jgi:dCMP deaminase